MFMVKNFSVFNDFLKMWFGAHLLNLFDVCFMFLEENLIEIFVWFKGSFSSCYSFCEIISKDVVSVYDPRPVCFEVNISGYITVFGILHYCCLYLLPSNLSLLQDFVLISRGKNLTLVTVWLSNWNNYIWICSRKWESTFCLIRYVAFVIATFG